MHARPLRDDAATIRAALTDPGELAAALGLCDGRMGRERGAWWREGPGVIVPCPLHGGSSCHVFEGRDGTVGWSCYGCNESGDALSLVAAVEGLDIRRDFPQVLQLAARIAGVSLDDDASPARATPRPMPPPRRAEPERLDDDAFAAVARALLEDDATGLEQHADRDGTSPSPCGSCGCIDARRYLDARALLAGALSDGWRVLPASEAAQRELVLRVVAAVGATSWSRAGLARKDDPSRIVWSRNRLVIPWRDRTGRVTALQRRLLEAPREGEPRYVQAGIVRDPYGGHRLRADGGPVAFVEGAADVIALRALLYDTGREDYVPGDRALEVLGLPGAGAWRAGWSELARGREAVIALDIDEREKAAAAVQRARAAMREDLDGCARSVQVFVPRLDGRAVKDWCDVWEALRW